MLFPNKQITFHRNKCPIIKVICYNFKNHKHSEIY